MSDNNDQHQPLRVELTLVPLADPRPVEDRLAAAVRYARAQRVEVVSVRRLPDEAPARPARVRRRF